MKNLALLFSFILIFQSCSDNSILNSADSSIHAMENKEGKIRLSAYSHDLLTELPQEIIFERHDIVAEFKNTSTNYKYQLNKDSFGKFKTLINAYLNQKEVNDSLTSELYAGNNAQELGKAKIHVYGVKIKKDNFEIGSEIRFFVQATDYTKPFFIRIDNITAQNLLEIF